MLSVLFAAFPVFALIALGGLFGKVRDIGPVGIAALNNFTAWLALPALLFLSLAHGTHGATPPLGFVLVAAISTFGLFAVAYFTCLPSAAGMADRALAALAASYSNTGFIGIPLLTALLGPTGTIAGVIASIITISALFALAVLLVEIGVNGGGSAKAVARVLWGVVKNPLVFAPLLGALWGAFGLPLPTPLGRLLELLGAAASPCALVTIGAFLALPGSHAEPRAMIRAVGLKLVAQPLIAGVLLWIALRAGLAIPRDWAVAAILLAALPTGTGPFMLAELHRREAALASRTILITTVIGALSVSLLAGALLG